MYLYFPGQRSPTFGTGQPSPARFAEARPAERRVMMQDRIAFYPVPPCAFGPLFNYNHGRGTAELLLPSNNPSVAWRSASSTRDVFGANQLFDDGHVEWVNMNRMVDVGEDDAPGSPCGNGDVMSVLP